MNYSKFQKFISSFLIFSLLFSITFNVPYFDFKIFAWSQEFYNLVSIIVDEDTYKEIKSEIETYSKNIQWVLENTKVVILPTPKNIDAFNIASLNEGLYNEWYKSIKKDADFESKLIWTVIVWDFNVPTVFANNTYSRTILPFTDFEDKVYIYNHETKRYEKNSDNKDWLKSEIWHWVITPNLWSFWENIAWLKDYFAKNDDYYKGTGNFKYSEWILNWNKIQPVPSVYDPFVFYYDQFREEKALNYNSFKAYEAYLENKEDILYNRYSKGLANKLNEKILWSLNKTISTWLEWILNKQEELWDKYPFWPPLESIISGLTDNNWPDTTNVYDIQTRHIINNITKQFIGIFAKWIIWWFREDVHNAWRYNKTDSKVNVDTIPYFITMLDTINSEIIKDVNTELENYIDAIVLNGLASDILIPEEFTVESECSEAKKTFSYYWKKASEITNASECTIYRWTTRNHWTLVEANRAYNVNNSQPDIVSCDNWRNYPRCIQSIWRWNTPLNLESNPFFPLRLKSQSYEDLPLHIFDINWSIKSTDSTKIPSPLNCLPKNAQTKEEQTEKECERNSEWNETWFFLKLYNNLIWFYSDFLPVASANFWIWNHWSGGCSTTNIYVNGNSFASSWGSNCWWNPWTTTPDPWTTTPNPTPTPIPQFDCPAWFPINNWRIVSDKSFSSNSSWQNTNPASWCYYACNDWFIWTDCSIPTSCASEPTWANINTITPWLATDVLQKWQNTNSYLACYYTCKAWFTWPNCLTPTSCADEKPDGKNIDAYSFQTWTPTAVWQQWQNTDPSWACFFECKVWYRWNTCLGVSPYPTNTGTIDNNISCKNLVINPEQWEVPFQTNFLCYPNNWSNYEISIKKWSELIHTSKEKNFSYKFDDIWDYTVECIINWEDWVSDCMKNIKVSPKKCNSLVANYNPSTNKINYNCNTSTPNDTSSTYKILISDWWTTKELNQKQWTYDVEWDWIYTLECYVNWERTISKSSCHSEIDTNPSDFTDDTWNPTPPEIEWLEPNEPVVQNFNYRQITSHIFHKSPTAEELSSQINALVAPNLPIDRDRYIDFIAADMRYALIKYPYLFRVKVGWDETVNLENAEKSLKDYLDRISRQINSLINKHNPSKLQWRDRELYETLLKTWEYPEANIDLYTFLKNKPNNTLNITWNSKEISYLDTLVLAIYWNNLNSISAKYAFVFDNYLIDQFWEPDINYLLPKNKKLYEIAYLWASWDARNMYVKMDPKAKQDNPYADIFSKNINLSSLLFWANIWDWLWWEDKEAIFKCAPPDWVPIWRWIPAIMCRLWNMMPPSISISDWVCGPSIISSSDNFLSNTKFSKEEKEEILQCSMVKNENWINNCIESKLDWWTIELTSDSEKYYYNKNAILKAEIKDKDWKTVKIANTSDIEFRLEKIEVAMNTSLDLTDSNKKTIYDVGDTSNRDLSKIKNYVTFKDWKIRSQYWIANYWIWVKSNDADISLKAYINIKDSNNNIIKTIESNDLKIQVRWDRLFNLSYKLNNSTTNSLSNSIKVSDKANLYLVDWFDNNIETVSNIIKNSSLSEEKMVLVLENLSSNGTKKPIEYPLKVSILKWNKQVVEDITIDTIGTFRNLLAIEESWSYKIEITDNSWFKTVKNIELLADIPDRVDINLGTNIIEKWWNVSTNFVTIYDKYNNPVVWNFYDLKMEITWNDSLEFLDNSSKSLNTTTYEWYKIFRLKSKNISWNNNIKITVSNSNGQEIINWLKNIRVLDSITLSVTPLDNEIKVWWWKYSYEISLIDWNWSMLSELSDFNSRVYMTASPVFIKTIEPYFEIKNWKAIVEFTTKTVAWEKVPVEFQIEWLKNIIQKNITILPDKPMKIDLNLSKNKMEASKDSYSTLSVELKDRYNNLVFNDNTTNTNLEILDQYSDIITSPNKNVKVKKWVSTFRIYWTNNPWVAYFKVWTDPSLELNSFTIKDENSPDLTIEWVWENVLKIETFYFWNKNKVQWKKYNSLYTTLLWSNYWDIYEHDYLAWSLLFERNNRALAVTSLLNNPYSYNNVLDLDINWWIKKLHSSWDLSQDIEVNTTFINGKLGFDINNKALNIYIAKVFYNFNNDTKLTSCDNDTIQSCIDKTNTSISLKSKSDKYRSYIDNNKLIFRDNYWKNLFEISKDWTINRLWTVDFEYNKNNTWKYLSINIKTWWQIIWELVYNFVNNNNNDSINQFTNELPFNNRIDNPNTKNNILVLLKTSSYWLYDNWNTNNKSKIFYYNDPFASNNKLNTFSKDNLYWIENFTNKAWIWWNEGNKSLLAFSAWKTVWESVQDYMSFWVINLWDPVVSLKNIKKKLPNSNIDRNFDSTIWKLLSRDDDIVWYQVFDYNKDNKKDILLIKNDNYLKLLENKNIEQNFIDMWNLAYIADLWQIDLIKTWDFTWDWYDDIFFVNKHWKPFLLNNIEKDFTRFSLEEKFNLSWRIVRAEKFDMDNDWIDDIVTLDDFWEINIFYWWWTSADPQFTKNTVSNDQWIKLNEEVRNDNWLVYFDWLYQPWDVVTDNIKIDNYLFLKYPYSKDKFNNSINEITGFWNVVDNSSYHDIWDIDFPVWIDSKYFLKSEYSEYSWLRVEKKFRDKNHGFMSSGDIIEVEITLKNLLNKKLDNVVFTEKVHEVFKLDKKSFKSEIDFDIYDWSAWFTYLIDKFDIPSGWNLKFTYEVKVQPLKYNYLEVWLFENWEVWDDNFWDIIIKPDNQNCSDSIEIYRSITNRTYQKWTKAPTCDSNKIRLPNELEQNTIDTDWNWVPDYIDRLTGDMNELKRYSQEQLAKNSIDSDNDWIPDDEDFFEMDWSITVDLWWIWEKIDTALTELDNLVQWLNCWFGNESCFASPLNWAPLAPWSDPVFMWKTIWDWLLVDEWIPIFSSMTWMQVWPLCIPTVWPISILSTWCSWQWAWWLLWIDNPTNFFRLFVTPTLTWWVWTAACFWWPARIAWYSNMPWISPLFPWWNCIVVAKKTFWCANDWSDWDPASIWIPNYSTDWNFWVINWNCSDKEEPTKDLSSDDIKEYLEEAKKGPVEKAFEFLPWSFSENPPAWLFRQSSWDSDISVSLDVESIFSWDFEDIIKIDMRRITPFPSWLMDWVTRQIEEIANKLTDFPTLFVILPDFSWIMNWDWWEFSWNNYRSQLDNLTIDPNLTWNETISNYSRKVNSWIREAYEFISNTPLVYIDQETVNIALPWLSEAELNRTIASRSNTLNQRETELERAKESWWWIWASAELAIDADRLVNSLRDNLEVIKSYADIPELINELITKKEDYLEQILCNIDTISYILWWRIWKNGIRFKAWVELYILIKAILKSWQLLVDVFLDYEQECHDCKNERQDALEEQFSWIDMIMPKIPIIRFPKWPDIILDLHNIRAWLRVTLPEYNITSKPIILPSLPNLYLPLAPDFNLTADLTLPQLPVLPILEIPQLPDLPTLPTIELPDLPPPPKLPKMIAGIEIVVDIIKLITKAMCILKSSPFHPEWRAWDQIAFLTERTWYLWSDFFEISLPEFSFPFVDAIKVTTYVNLEFEADFIVELAKQIAMPINAFTNDFTNIFNIRPNNIDLRNIWPKWVDINIDATIDDLWATNIKDKLSLIFANKISTNIQHLAKEIEKWKNETVDNLEFKKLINKSLSSKTITSDNKLEKVRWIWEEVNNMTYSKEDKLIKELQDNNIEKFEVVKDIINTEIIKNKELKKKYNSIWKSSIMTKVSSEDPNKIELYNKTLSKYNDKFVETAKKLIVWEWDNIKNELKEYSNDLMNSIKTPLENYSKWQKNIDINNRLLATNNVLANSNILAITSSTSWTSTPTPNSCQLQASSSYRYKYEWIYILEWGTSYRLFDYLSELNWDEKPTIVDLDNDGDEDILYFANGQLFFKENTKNTPVKSYVTTAPLIVKSENNKFYKNEFYEAINNAQEIWVNDRSIIIWFKAPTNKEINNFRVWFYKIVDKFLNKGRYNYRPENIKKDIIDWISWINEVTKRDENENFILRKNIAYIDKLSQWNLWVKLKTVELIDIKDDLTDNKIVYLNKWTKLYAWWDSFNITYFNVNNEKERYSKLVRKYENIEFSNNIKIVSITWNAYIKWSNNVYYDWMEIRDYIGKPLFPWSTITYSEENELMNYLEIKYYDESKLELDFSEISSWELQDLWYKTSDYYIRTNRDNDYYYAKVNSFKDNINSTLSNQILLAPQREADSNSPELSISSIKIPVYQKKLINLTEYIYEDWWIGNIKKVIIDMDLWEDTNSDWNNKNDDSSVEDKYKDKIDIRYSEATLRIEFWKFDTIFSRKIWITLIDENDNVWYKEVDFEVYAPTPKVEDYLSWKVEWEIDEELTYEPISLFRFRWGVISSLKDNNQSFKTDTDVWKYWFDMSSVNNSTNWLTLSFSGEEVAYINENTWKISLKDNSSSIKIDLNSSWFPKMTINKDWQDIFTQFIQVHWINRVKVTENIENQTIKWIYFKLINKENYWLYTIPENIDYNPWALSIYKLNDPSKQNVFTIFKDWRIKKLNQSYKLTYENSSEDYLYFNLMENNIKIWILKYVINSDYIIR